MQEKVLIFRSAKHYIVDNLIDDLKRKDNPIIYLLVQEESKEHYKEDENLKLISYPEGFFNYEKMLQYNKLKDKLLGETYTKIYVPYSTEKPKIEEIEKIILNILKCRKIYLYDKTGKVRKYWISKWKYQITKRWERIKIRLIDINLHIIGIWYMRGLK